MSHLPKKRILWALALAAVLLPAGSILYATLQKDGNLVAAYEPALACALVLNRAEAAEDRMDDGIYKDYCHHLADDWSDLNRALPDPQRARNGGYAGLATDEDVWLASLDKLVKVNGKPPLPPKA